jgi:hypothetical protein
MPPPKVQTGHFQNTELELAAATFCWSTFHILSRKSVLNRLSTVSMSATEYVVWNRRLYFSLIWLQRRKFGREYERQEERIKQCRQRTCNVTLWRIGVMIVGMEKELCFVSLLSAVSQSTIQSNIIRMNVVIKTQEWVPCTLLYSYKSFVLLSV